MKKDSPRPMKTTSTEDNTRKTAGNGINKPVVPNVKTTQDDIEEHEKKTTFVSKNRARVSENIKMFQELEKGAECLLGSGRCSTHNVKLVRNVSMKRVSTVTDSGNVRWTMREGVTLACPHKQGLRATPAIEPAPLKTEGTNGNKRICLSEKMDQPQTEPGI